MSAVSGAFAGCSRPEGRFQSRLPAVKLANLPAPRGPGTDFRTETFSGC